MITLSDESWATTTLRDAQDPGAGHQEWPGLSRITLERYNLIFSQQHSRGYSSTGQPQHDAGTVLENSLATLFKIALDTDLKLTKWSVANGLAIDDATIVANANISDTARPSLWLGAGATATVTVFYVDEDDDYIHYIQSTDGAFNFGAEQNVGTQANLKAIAAVSATKVHCVSYTNGNSRFHFFEDDGGWSETNSLIYWPHQIEHIDAITIGNRDLIVFYSNGPMYGNFREAGIYGIWEKHGRWSDIFKIDVLDEADTNSYRKEPMISTANGIYFLTGWLSEGDAEYNHTTRFLKTSKDGQYWSQYQPLVTTPEAGPAILLVAEPAPGQSWPWSTGKQCYIVGYDKVYESDATRLVGEENTSLQVDVSSRTLNWSLGRGVISQANTILGNHDGVLDAHAIINDDNTLLLKREAGYWTGAAEEYAQLTLEAVDVIKETDQLPKRHKQVVSRDFMAWMRDREADHHEEWESQLVGYDNYHDDTDTSYGGLSHTATQTGWWKTGQNMLWLVSDNKEGIAFATWDSRIMNGQHKAMVRIETGGNSEYAGVIFRAHDKDNFLTAYYDQATDKILLKQKYNGEWRSTLASSGALSWSIDTFYGLMVDFRYSYVRVFYSTDGLSWTQAFTYTIPRPAEGAPPEYGYVGVIGYGYSDQDEDDPPAYDPPLPPPGPGPDDLGPPGPAVAGHTVSGFYYTAGYGDEWEQRNGGLSSTDILDLIWDPWWFTPERQGTNDPEQAIYLACGVGWVAKKVGTADWTDITPSTNPPNSWGDVTAPTVSTVTYKQLHGDIHALDTFYVLTEWQEVDSGTGKWRGWIAKTIDNGASWTWYNLTFILSGADYTFAWDTSDAEGWTPLAHPDYPAYVTFWVDEDKCSQHGNWDNIAPTPNDSYQWVYLQYAYKVSFDEVTFDAYNWGGFNVGGTYKRIYTSPDGADPWTLVLNDYLEGTSCIVYNYVLAVSDKYIRALVLAYGWFFHGGEQDARLNQLTFKNFSTGPDELRPLAMDVDTEDGSRIYVTTWQDGTLYIQRRTSSSLSLSQETTIGTATEAQVAAKTYFVVPRCPHVPTTAGFGDYVWVFGRYNDGAEKHLAYSSDGAVSFANKGSGSWDSNHRLGAIEVLSDNLTIYAFVNHASTPRLWKTTTGGSSWSDVNSIPFNLEFDAFSRCNWSEDEEFLIGRNGANAQMAAWLESPYTGTWQDATGSPGLPTAAYISSIIWV